VSDRSQLLATWKRLEAGLLSSLPEADRPAGRAAVRFSAGIAPWGLAFSVVFVALGQPLLAASLGVAAAGVACTGLVTRATGSLAVSAHWLNLFLAQSLLVPAWLLGGLLAACVPWLGVCVVVATFLAGPRVGALWALVAVVAVGGLYVAHLTGRLPAEVVGPSTIWALAMGAHAGLFCIVWVLVATASVVNERRAAELVAARMSADRANRAKSAFLARMSHELRTPLNVVIGYAELLEEDATSGQVQDLQRIVGAGHHLLRLVNDVLDLSKVEAGQLEFSPRSVEVRSLADDVMVAVEPLLQARDTRGEVGVGSDVVVWADPLRLRQCLLNLLSNAAKFTESGRVAVTAMREGDRVRIDVVDDGAGIDPEALPDLFDPFVQAHDPVEGPAGTGLGLALVKQFVEQMGGSVEVESSLGRGSRFGLWMPVGPGPADGAGAGAGRAPGPPQDR